MSQLVGEVPAEAVNVLLSSPTLRDDDGEACARLLEAAGTAPTDVVWVTFTSSPGTCVAVLQDRLDEQVGGVVIAVGERRSGGPAVPDGVTVERVESPADLTGLSIEIRRHLEGPEGPRALCFDSLTALLQYADLTRTFEFLHVLTGQVVAMDGRAHYHLDPEAHDDRTIATLTGLFDAAITVTDDAVTVRSVFDG